MHSEGAKKLSSRYNTRRQLELGILTDSKVVLFLLFQSFKHLIHWILKGFIILANFHRIQEFDQGCKVLLFQRCLIVDITDQGTIQQRLCL